MVSEKKILEFIHLCFLMTVSYNGDALPKTVFHQLYLHSVSGNVQIAHGSYTIKDALV